MTNTGLPDGLPAALPPEVVAVMRAELPSLADEIIAALQREFPEYDRPMDGSYGQALRTGVRQALGSFADLAADPAAPCAQRDEVFRALGRFEAGEGRSPETLQAAFLVGARMAWQRVMTVGPQVGLSSVVISELADQIFGYVRDLATLSVQGYHEARAHWGDARHRHRQRLLTLLTGNPPAARQAVTDLAGLAGWTVPDEVTPVAVQAWPAAAVPEPGAAVDDQLPAGSVRPLGDDVLADITGAQPCLLLPGPLTEGRRCALEGFLAGRRAAVGLTIPPESAGDSLRWARRALALCESGVIDDGPVILCEHHLVTLLLLSDEALAEQLIRHQFALLASLPERRRGQLTETITALLEASGTVVEAADRLHLHPQTVRYRRRQLQETFGSQLADPQRRFDLELALRVSRLRQAQQLSRDVRRPG